MKLLLDNLPPTLANERDALTKCMEAFNRVRLVRESSDRVS